MKNQTALPSLTVNPSNVLPSLPPFLRPPSSPPLSSPFSLSTFHPRADAPSECRSRPWSTNTISPCDPFIVARTSQEVNARPAGTDGETTRRRRRRRMAGTGLRRHGQPHSEPRRPWEQHLLRGSARSHRRPPARSSSSSSSGARPTARPQQQQQHQPPQHQQQTATQQQHHKFARSEHHNLGRRGANSSR